MRIVALLTVRNEERYIKRCLEHLLQEGIEVCLTDNGSTDRTLEIAESFRKKNIIRIEHMPFNGSYELKPILLNSERLAKEINADWYIHYDADEINQAPRRFKTLKDAIIEVDKQGFNAINFDEFVFLPTVEDPDHEGKDYVKTMSSYYFFEPFPTRLIRAWKNFHQKVDIAGSGGHRITFAKQKIFPESFILRHYIILSHAHAIAKFCGRVYSEKEVINNLWHIHRVKCRPSDLVLPKAAKLKTINDSAENPWNRSNPWRTHFFTHTTLQSKGKKIKNKIKRQIKRFYKALNKTKTSSNNNINNEPPFPFIVGVGRSGTTLLRLMLDSHPELAIPLETHFIPDFLNSLKSHKVSKKKFFKTIVLHLHWPDFHISPNSFQKSLDNLEPFTYSKGIRAFYSLYAEKFNKKRWGDKTPLYDHHMISISKLLPEAHFIHIIRDGRDVALSYRGKWFGPGNDIKDLATNWVWRISETRRQAQHLSNYKEVRFEDLINNPESILKDICEFIDLPYSIQMLEYHKVAGQRLSELENRYSSDGSIRLSKEKRIGLFKLTSNPPDKRRVQCWRNEMSSEDRIKFEAIAGDLLNDLKY